MTRLGSLLIVFSLLSFPLFSQTVSIPDTSFLYALITEGVDSNSDSIISNTEAEAVTSLIIPSYNITDLRGIEAFVNLDELDCNDNSLTSVDVSNNTALTDLDLGLNEFSTLDLSNNTTLIHLNVGGNEISTLDISNNTLLEWFLGFFNDLTSLDISSNPALVGLYLKGNLLDSLNVSSNTALQYLKIGRNQLTRLDVINNTSLVSLSIDEMPTLKCVRVWELPFPPEDVEIDTTKSPNVVFTKDYCPGVGIEDFSQTGLSIYPNPTSSILTIEIEQTDHYSIYFTTLSGQMVFSTEMEGTSHQLDLSSFQNGVYFMTIRSKDFVTTKKIIKL